MRQILGDGEYDLETIERWGGTRSALDTPLWTAISDWVGETEPGAKLAPLCCAGFTDSHWLREAFGTVAYGFFPMETMDVGARRAPDPLGRRADARRRSGARRRVPARRRPLAGVAVLELRSPEGAFELIEALPARARLLRPRRRGPGGRPLPRLRPLRAAPPHARRRPHRSRAPCPSQPCPSGTRRGPGQAGRTVRIGKWERTLERRGVRGGGGGRAGRDRAWRRLPGESRAAPLGAVLRRSRRAGSAARRLRAAHDGRRRLGDRLRLAGALPRPPRPAGAGRARSRERGRSASTWRVRRTRPST